MHILLVEDNPADAELTELALRAAPMSTTLHTAMTGTDALNYLYRRPPHEESPRPGLVLLDLNLPGIDGNDVLSTIKGDPALRRIPVVVLTSSRRQADIDGAYDGHANSYVAKPSDFRSLEDVLSHLCDYWFVRVEGPSRG